MIREQVMNVNEVAKATDKVQEIRKEQQETCEQLQDITSRLETHGSAKAGGGLGDNHFTV
ncbi:hypothetical protein [Paenibacillus sp. FSL W8-0194]|uniref:hypothetical protein n=1 Tax=Paenibacillus sp. FSL W8-0194 TaxID=2921711 RepID=UPI0030DBB9B3